MSAIDVSRRVHTFVIGASAGGVEALRALVAQLPADFPGVVLVVLHVAPMGTSVLPHILERAGELAATHPEDGEPIEPGHVYVAPPDQHLLVEDHHVRLDRGPKVHGHRPAIDALFRSAAHAYGRSAAGVVLSGVLDDGAAGLLAIKRAGGVTLVQDPRQALYDMMPRSAIEFVQPDLVATAEELGRLMVSIAQTPPDDSPKGGTMVGEHFVEVDRGSSDAPQPGTPNGLTCPECNGGLWETVENGVAYYRCRVGHEYAQDSFVVEQGARVEAALWTALRTLEEQAALNRRIALRHREKGRELLAERYELRADSAVEQALTIRDVLDNVRPLADEEEVA